MRDSNLKEHVVRASCLLFGLALSLCVLEVLIDRLVSRGYFQDVFFDVASWEREHYDQLWTKHPSQFRSFHLDTIAGYTGTRVLTLGDSYTWGDKIGQTSDIWPYVMERHLQSQGKDVRVLNLGQRGFTTANAYELFLNEGLALKPNLIVLQWLINDALPSLPGYEHGAERDIFGTWRLPYSFHDPLADWSKLYLLVATRAERWYLSSIVGPAVFDQLYQEKAPGWLQMQEAIRRFATVTRQQHIKFVLVQFPRFAHRGTLSEAHAAIQEKVKSYAESYGVKVFDLSGEFEDRVPKGGSWWALPNDSHPSPEAHDIAGNRIASWVLNELD